MKDALRYEKLRLNGFMIGAILFVAMLFVASSVTAIVNLVLIALPLLTMAAVIGIIAFGIPMIFTGIQAGREARAHAAATPGGAMLMSLEGFRRHAPIRSSVPTHFTNFQAIDNDSVIHFDSKSDENPMTMREFKHMTSGSQAPAREVETSLEGLTDYRRI